MEREDFFRGSSVFILIPLILTKFIKRAFPICISQTRKLAREGRTSWARTRRCISSGSRHRIDLSLHGNKRTSSPSVDFLDLDSSHFPGVKKKMGAGWFRRGPTSLSRPRSYTLARRPLSTPPESR